MFIHWTVQCTQLCPTLCHPMDGSTPSFPVHHQLLEMAQLMSTESVMPSNNVLLWHSLLLLPLIFPSIRVFSNESIRCIRWSKYWTFSFIIHPLSEYSGLISFQFSSVQSLSCVWLFVTPWTAACQASLSITNSWSLPKPMSIESVMPSHPLLSPSPPALNLCQHQGLL